MHLEATLLSDWQEQYLTSTRAYPIATKEEHIIPLLSDPFCRAVIFRHSDYAFDESCINVVEDAPPAQ